jgi:hypothetical protein
MPVMLANLREVPRNREYTQMDEQALKAVLAWEALTASEQTAVQRTSIALDQHIVQFGTALTPFRIDIASEWSPQMRALLTTWLASDGWRARFADLPNGSLQIQLVTSS